MILRETTGSIVGDTVYRLLGGIAVLTALSIGWPGVQRFYDQHLSPAVWIDPLIQVVPAPDGKPRILYGARASMDLRGEWSTYLEVGAIRCCTSKGTGIYVEGRAPSLWDWMDFFDRDLVVPGAPFRVCVSYDLTTNAGAQRQFGPFCSKEYQP
jgi:hypothetical protein